MKERMVNIKSIEFEIDQKFIDLENHVWKTNAGRMIPVRRMTTAHIRNCITCWNTGRIHPAYHGGKRKWLRIFRQELVNRQ